MEIFLQGMRFTFLLQNTMESAKNADFREKPCLSWPLPARWDRLRRSAQSGSVQDMARKKLIVLDPERSFEVASRHLYRCRKCKNAGMEWARRKNLCRRGRQLLRDLDKIEQIYETAERAA
ncbi:MAG: hypothetical protein DMG39_06075 [Acidobacteria bacterium]|nr:MAG: hypothetical protein DMG39_06075 [Acidobacteriota bacterium]